MMGKRHEMKYTLSPKDSQVLLHRIQKVLRRDPHCPKEGYQVTSLYYDDPYNTAYKQKINGEAIRHKYRIRYYDHNWHVIKLERKSKVGQMTVKESVPLTEEEVFLLQVGEIDFLLEKKASLYHDFYINQKHNLHKPKVVVSYNRLAYVHPVGDLRVTFDRDIRRGNSESFMDDEGCYLAPAIDDRQVVVEVKFNHVLPDFIRSIMELGHVQQSAASKYVMARRYNTMF